jgi:hypothetical protein
VAFDVEGLKTRRKKALRSPFSFSENIVERWEMPASTTTAQKFPFSVKTAHALKLREPHVITVTGKAFYDLTHAPADHSNRRHSPKDYAVWEIHPVMQMQVIQ